MDETGSLAVAVLPSGTTPDPEPTDQGTTPGETPGEAPGATPSAPTTSGSNAGSGNGSGDGSGNDTSTGGGELSSAGANGVLPILGIAFLALLGGAPTFLVRRRRNHG